MSWSTLLELIAEEAGMEIARRVEERARYELGGVRITVSVKPWVTPEQIEDIAPGKPKQAAKRLGISPSKAYTLVGRKRLTIR